MLISFIFLLPQSGSRKLITLGSPSEKQIKILLLFITQSENLTLIRNTWLLEKTTDQGQLIADVCLRFRQ